MGDVPESARLDDKGLQDAEKGCSSEEVLKKPQKSLNKSKIAFGLIMFAAIIVVIVLPTVLIRNSNDSSDDILDDSVDPEGNEGNEGNSSQSQVSYLTTEGIFETNIELLHEGVTDGYQDEEEFSLAVDRAVDFLLGTVYKTNMGMPGFAMDNGRTNTPPDDTMDADAGDQNLEQAPALGAPESDAGNEKVEANDGGYDTNNQEDNVEEGDLVVSDGEYVYTAYGKYLVIWNASSGKIVKELEMPAIEGVNQGNGQGDTMYKSMIWGGWQEPYIQSLVLHEETLLVVLSGYGESLKGHPEDHVLYDYLGTRVHIYDKSALIDSRRRTNELLGQVDLNGRFNAVRVVGENAHIVTTSDIDTYTDLQAPFERWILEADTDEEYTRLVQEIAPEKKQAFKDKLINDLKAGGNNKEIPSLVRITMWETEASGTALEEMIYREGGIMRSLALVSSFSLKLQSNSNEQTAQNALVVKESGAFVPASWGQVYGNEDKILVATNVWQYDHSTGNSQESTALLAVQLSGASSKPHSIGMVPGSVLNQHSLDIVDNILRIAVSVRNWVSIRFFTEPAMSDTDVEGNGNALIDERPIMFIPPPPPSTENYVILLEMPGADGEVAGEMKELGRLQLGLPGEWFTAVRFFDNIAYAVTFERKDPLYALDLSDPYAPKITANFTISGYSEYLHSFNPNGPGEPNTVLIAIGKEADEAGNELGLQISLFDLSVPGEVDILDRYNIEESYDAYSWSDSSFDFKSTRFFGSRLFIPVDIYDSTNSFHGFMVFKITMEGGIEEDCRVSHTENYYGYYYEEPMLDYEDVNPDIDYEDVNTNTEEYLVEVTTDGEDALGTDTDAGVDANDQILPPEYTKEPYNGDSGACHKYYASLPRRSMVFDDKWMTMYNSEIISTDLQTCEQVWKNDIAIEEC